MTQSSFTLALNFIRFAVTYVLFAGVYTYGESHQISIQDAFSKIETIAGNGNLASNSGKGDGGYATNASFGILTGLLLLRIHPVLIRPNSAD